MPHVLSPVLLSALRLTFFPTSPHITHHMAWAVAAGRPERRRAEAPGGGGWRPLAMAGVDPERRRTEASGGGEWRSRVVAADALSGGE